MEISRRTFLHTSATVTAGFCGLRNLVEASTADRSDNGLVATGYGPLDPDPAGLLDLPKGFRYSIISRAGERMDDGLLLPWSPDGMATFSGPNGLTILIRNHESIPCVRGPWGEQNKLLWQVDTEKVYDFGMGNTPGCGGTTTVVYDTKRQKVVRQFLSLAGTWLNCAGGPTPWNSWITCEEIFQNKGFSMEYSAWVQKDHGYTFEVPASVEPGLVDPVPLKSMGRFRHEAVAVNRESGIVYETEDCEDGLLYRFTPNRVGQLAKGGKLQALKIKDQSSVDTRNWDKTEQLQVGQMLAVEWIDLEDVDSQNDDLRARGFGAGAARFARGEGIWAGHREVYFACTSGGILKKGQIWRYIPSPFEGTCDESNSPAKLQLFVEPNDSNLVENADNLTITPWGDLIVCEDRSGDIIRLVGVTPQGKLYTFARNHLNTEFAGATFSPDGSTLFVNMQGRGLTAAITGPWQL